MGVQDKINISISKTPLNVKQLLCIFLMVKKGSIQIFGEIFLDQMRKLWRVYLFIKSKEN
ncbi:hypothetical protein MNBD_BACTEROID01-58 [hydrothermal vent metagenome]|uniref:Uncharacterized protein n=1 Tax=hydrothermal vent metagenome TaxID=652676 RepID=A0A3B0UUW6_9ZZZZ